MAHGFWPGWWKHHVWQGKKVMIIQKYEHIFICHCWTGGIPINTYQLVCETSHRLKKNQPTSTSCQKRRGGRCGFVYWEKKQLAPIAQPALLEGTLVKKQTVARKLFSLNSPRRFFRITWFIVEVLFLCFRGCIPVPLASHIFWGVQRPGRIPIPFNQTTKVTAILVLKWGRKSQKRAGGSSSKKWPKKSATFWIENFTGFSIPTSVPRVFFVWVPSRRCYLRWWQLKYFWNIHPYLGKIPILTNSFQRGWKHQLVIYIEESKDIFKIYLSTWGIIPLSKWSITVVTVSPLPLPNGLSTAYKWGWSDHHLHHPLGSHPPSIL